MMETRGSVLRIFEMRSCRNIISIWLEIGIPPRRVLSRGLVGD